VRPALDPLTFPDAAFQGDTLVVTVKGRNLENIHTAHVRPAKGMTISLGDPLSQSKQPIKTGPDELTLTLAIDRLTPPGEKWLWVESEYGNSPQLMLTVMLL
jgi:hypothetical protein